MYTQKFHGHYRGQPVLAGFPVKNRRILLEQSFTDHMLLLTAASKLKLERRCYSSVQWC